MNSEITVTEVNKANQLQEEGKLEDAIAVYRRLTKKLYRELGTLLSQQKKWDDAIATYRHALELNPEDYECHHQLGEAIYHRVMENPETFFSEYNLAEVTHKDYQVFDPELPEVCFLNDEAFLQATAHLDDDTYTVEWYRVYLRRSLSEAEKQACINWLQTPGHIRELGLKIWRESLAEFQTMLRHSFKIVGLEEAVNCYHRAIELSPNHHTSCYRLAEVFTEQGKHEEALVIYHLSNNQERSTRSFRDEWKKAIYLQQSIVQTGYVYGVCPWSGRILRSQESFCYFPWIFYRFVGNEIFYLIVGDWFSSKQCIYLPRLDIIIVLYPFPHMDFTWLVNHLKSHLVSSWQKVQAYLSNQPKEVAVVLGISNLGHYLWNELSGVHYFYKKRTFNQVHKFLLDVRYEFFNFEEIFPEIDSTQIIRVEDSQKISQKILEDKLFVVRLVDFFIDEELVNRMYQECIKKSSQIFLEKVAQAQTHFPLLWIGIRNYKRKWLSQTEGIAKIITKIYEDFPDLAIVFDAWSITERYQGEDDEVIAVEQACLEQIMLLLPPGIPTYSTIGRPIYETIVWAQAINLYAVPFGTGMTFVTWIASKPGVAYGNKNYYAAVQGSFSPIYRENLIPPVLISTEYITEDENNIEPSTRNYDCDWQVIYNELMQILQNLPKRI